MKRFFISLLSIFSLVLIILVIVLFQIGNAKILPVHSKSINSEILTFSLQDDKGGKSEYVVNSPLLFASLDKASPIQQSFASQTTGNSQLAATPAISVLQEKLPFLANLYIVIALLLLTVGILVLLLYKTYQVRKSTQRSEKRFRSMLDSNPSAIMIFQNFKLRYVNSAFSTLTGYSSDELQKMEVWQLIHPDSIANPLPDSLEIEGKSFNFRGEFEIITKNREARWVDMSTRSVEFEGKPAVLASAIDITDKKNDQKQLIEKEERYKNFFSKNSAVMLITDPDTGHIHDANKAASDYYGYSREELIGKNITDLNVLSDEQIKEQMQKAKSDQKSYYYLRQKLADGSERDVEVYTSQIMVQSMIYNYCIIFDITERMHIERELKKAKEQAEEATKVKSFFVSNLSHEIRNPLNSIIGLTDLMIEAEDLSEVQMKNMESIKYASDHLLGVINDVLDFSKLEAGKVEIENIDFDLYKLVSETAKTFEFKAKEKGLDLNVSMDPTLPPVLKGDPSRLRQILINLISNALKFTDEGHIDIQLKVLNKEDGKVEIKFSVSDTGFGIPEEKQQILFQSFMQVNNGSSSQMEGTGLGLAISKKLVELQQGTIGMKSIVGMGSTFWFTIPYETSDKVFVPDLSKRGIQMRNLSGIKILLVEDDQMNQFVMKQILEKWNATLDIARNGREAIAKLEKSDYSIVLMDLHMPEVNGYEATRMIRNPQSTVRDHSIPIVALTADVTTETRQKVKEAGMNDFITKPSKQEKIYETISKVISGHKTTFIARKEPETDILEENKNKTEKSKLRIKKALTDIFDEDTDGIIALIARFIKEIPRTIVGINEAYYDQDYATVGKLVHKIKPGYSYMGFSEVSEKISRIQELTKSRGNLDELEHLCKELDEDSRYIVNILREIHKEYMKDNSIGIGQKT